MENISSRPLSVDWKNERVWALEINDIYDYENKCYVDYSNYSDKQWNHLNNLLDRYLVLIFKRNYDFDEIKLQEFLGHLPPFHLQMIYIAL